MSDDDLSTFDLNIGRTMRMIRLQRGVTLTEAGAMVGLTYQQIQKYEGGISSISASTLYHFAKAMRCSIGTFFENMGEVHLTTNIRLSKSRGDVADAQALARIENPGVRQAMEALVLTIAEQTPDTGGVKATAVRRKRRRRSKTR
jgi:transcriptional regulator with XRE-family HTH domain